MMNIKEFYILGLPIQTEIGNCHFIKVKEYPDYFMDLQVISLTKNHIINKYHELNKDRSLDEFIEELNRVSLYEIAIGIPDVKESYFNVFSKVFNDDQTLTMLTEENFDYYRKLIMEMNVLKEEKLSPNPEIQRAIDRSRALKSQDGDKLEFSDIVSSVVGYNGLSYIDLNEFTVYQLYMTYYRIAQIKNYDTTTLFATVASDKVNIENWSKHINLYEEENHSITKDQLTQKADSLFN
jgi:hypothetical protein